MLVLEGKWGQCLWGEWGAQTAMPAWTLWRKEGRQGGRKDCVGRVSAAQCWGGFGQADGGLLEAELPVGRALGLSETGHGGSPASVSVWERPTQCGLSSDSVVDPERRDGHQSTGRVVAFHSRPNWLSPCWLQSKAGNLRGATGMVRVRINDARATVSARLWWGCTCQRPAGGQAIPRQEPVSFYQAIWEGAEVILSEDPHPGLSSFLGLPVSVLLRRFLQLLETPSLFPPSPRLLSLPAQPRGEPGWVTQAPLEHRWRNQSTFLLTWASWLESQAHLPLEQNSSFEWKLNSLGLVEIKTSFWTKTVLLIKRWLTVRCEVWGSTKGVREVWGRPYWLAS